MELNKWYDLSKVYNTNKVKHVVYFYPIVEERVDYFSCYDGKTIKKHIYLDGTFTFTICEDNTEVIYDNDLSDIEEVEEEVVKTETKKLINESLNKLF